MNDGTGAPYMCEPQSDGESDEYSVVNQRSVTSRIIRMVKVVVCVPC